jgi:hypothetical protein
MAQFRSRPDKGRFNVTESTLAESARWMDGHSSPLTAGFQTVRRRVRTPGSAHAGRRVGCESWIIAWSANHDGPGAISSCHLTRAPYLRVCACPAPFSPRSRGSGFWEHAIQLGRKIIRNWCPAYQLVPSPGPSQIRSLRYCEESSCVLGH